MKSALIATICSLALGACWPFDPPKPNLPEQYGYLDHLPPDDLVGVGDLMVITGTGSARNLARLCPSVPGSISIYKSGTVTIGTSTTINASPSVDVTADVNAALKLFAAALPKQFPAINASLQAGATLVRSAKASADRNKIREADIGPLMAYFPSQRARPECVNPNNRPVYVVQRILVGDITYNYQSENGLSGGVQAEFGDLAKMALKVPLNVSTNQTVTGEGLVFGFALLDPKTQLMVTPAQLDLAGKTQKVRALLGH